MHPIVCVFDPGGDRNLIRANILDSGWPESIRQRYLPKIQSASNTRLVVSGTFTLRFRMGESHIPVI